MWRRLQQFWLILCLLGDFPHHLDESVYRHLALAFCRLYHHCLVEEQREVDGRRMIPIVEQAFSHIHSGDSCRLVCQAVEYELMLAESCDRQFIYILQRLLDIVGIECGKRSYIFDILLAERKYVGVCLEDNAEIAVIRTDAECRVMLVVGQELLQSLSHSHRATSWSATSVRCRECLVQVDVHHVESHITRTTSAEHRVEVRSIVIHQCTTLMNELGNLWNVSLE